MLTREAGDAHLHRRAIPAEAPGFRRVALRGTPYPTLARGPGTVAGLLVRPPPAALVRLHVYEGPFYRLAPLRVRTARGPLWARAWIAPPWRASGRPWP
ncbi:gamma-glutamylcyclotransferase family protein [Roseomonas sp. E05]|uniref:gamma-glutamylcyclotransferase family protein n=1 Tax=Roseomonas sp. E05 TaxID=3046310 RepID=UPI0024B8B500|nr:gamma-glutamylcyclotransferase family protein [Roseomonas sp. E05]MDJ0390824.1 gamma-glutamylcyclotransferase family protein [Roseomonas sp. E05]